jgi:hypothetical protein
MKLISQKKSNQSDLPFGVRATAALGISIVVDALDYIGAPLFALPIAGDIVDAIVMAILYQLNRVHTTYRRYDTGIHNINTLVDSKNIIQNKGQ